MISGRWNCTASLRDLILKWSSGVSRLAAPLFWLELPFGEVTGEFVSGFDHGNRFELLEAFSESILQTPESPWRKFRVRRIEVVLVGRPGQVPWKVNRSFDEGFIYQEPGGYVSELSVLPARH